MATIITIIVFISGKNLPDFITTYFHPQSASTEKKEVLHSKVTMSETAYRKELQQSIASEMCIFFCYYDDYNGNGDCEMFGFVTKKDDADYYRENHENVFNFNPEVTGEIWFVNQNGARKIEPEITCWFTIPHILPLDDVKFIAFEKYLANSSITDLWGVNESGEPYQPNISGKGNGISINENYEIELVCSSYDFSYEPSFKSFLGHTWKPYYFYWGGANFKEYAGKHVSLDTLYKVNGFEELLEQVLSELNAEHDDVQIVAEEIYYRENGIININFQCRQNNSVGNYTNYNATLRYIDDKLKIIPGEFGLCNEGKYKSAFIPSIATPPESSFESLFL